MQELGSVIGPLYGAVVLAFGTWRDIFWINLAVGLVLAAAIATLARHDGGPDERPHGASTADADYPIRRLDWLGSSLLALVSSRCCW